MAIDLKSLAREGARVRVAELMQEIAEIRRSFPDLAERAVSPLALRRRRRPMTPAERKAVGIRMKAYWAARRKAKG